MLRTRNRTIAAEHAAESGRCFGFCVVDGLYYVGTRDQLLRLPIIRIEEGP